MKTIELECLQCKQKFNKKKGEYNRKVRENKINFFCTQSCATTYSNKRTPHGNLKNLVPNNRKDEYSPFRFFTRRIRARTKTHEGTSSDIDKQYLKKIWEEQNGICPLTGYRIVLPLNTSNFLHKRHPYNASLDRIDSSKWYIKGNVRFVCLIANYAKAEWTDEVVIDFCKQVTENN